MNKENKKFIVETLFLKESLKRDLTLKEFLVLMYFDNDYELIFDVKKISKALCLSENDVLNTFESLLEKKLIVLNSIKNENGKLIDKVSLDNLYSGIKNNIQATEKAKEPNDLFSEFQKEYGRSLSGMDYEIINAWLANGFSEELIIGALKEALYNGVPSLRYIDKVLFDWKKKGFKTMNDVTNHLKQRSENKDTNSNSFEDSVLEFNWLDED